MRDIKNKLGIIKRDQPFLNWMKREGTVHVFGIKCPSLPESNKSKKNISKFPANDERRVFIFDPPTEKLRPVVFRDRYSVIDYSSSGETTAVLFKDEQKLHLSFYDSGVCLEIHLPDEITIKDNFRILLSGNILFLFSGGGVYKWVDNEWKPFLSLYGNKHGTTIPQYLLNDNGKVYAGYESGEFGGAIFKFDKYSGTWKNIEEDYLADSYIYKSPKSKDLLAMVKGKASLEKTVQLVNAANTGWKEGVKELGIFLSPVSGIKKSPDNHIWLSTGISHMGNSIGALYELNGDHWIRIIPDKIQFAKETDITGFDFMPNGDLRLVAGFCGILELKNEKLNTIFKMDWYHHHGQCIFCVDLLIDQYGRNFAGTFDSGVILCRGRNNSRTIQRLTFDMDTPVIQLEDIVENYQYSEKNQA